MTPGYIRQTPKILDTMNSNKAEMIADGTCSHALELQKQRSSTSELQQDLKHNSTPDQVAAEEDIIPETGWAWMVLIGCFMYRLLSIGLISSFGVLIVALEHYFHNGSVERLSWIGSLVTGLFYFIGKYQFLLLSNVLVCQFVLLARWLL